MTPLERELTEKLRLREQQVQDLTDELYPEGLPDKYQGVSYKDLVTLAEDRERRIVRLWEEAGEHSDRLATVKTRNENLSNEINALKIRVNQLTAIRDTHEKKIEELTKEGTESQRTIRRLSNYIDRLKEAKQDPELVAEVAYLKRELEASRQETNYVQDESWEWERKAEKLEKELAQVGIVSYNLCEGEPIYPMTSNNWTPKTADEIIDMLCQEWDKLQSFGRSSAKTV